jgi:hypothetical protein
VPKVPRFTKRAGGLQWLGFVDAVTLICREKGIEEADGSRRCSFSMSKATSVFALAGW